MSARCNKVIEDVWLEGRTVSFWQCGLVDAHDGECSFDAEKQINALTKERDDLRTDLAAANTDKSIVREAWISADAAAKEQHARAEGLAKERDDLAARCAVLVEALKAVDDHSSTCRAMLDIGEFPQGCDCYLIARNSALSSLPAAATKILERIAKLEADLLSMDGEALDSVKRVDDLCRANQLLRERNAKFEKASKLSRVAMYHIAPADCWATGPMTGDAIADLVICPGCTALNALSALDAQIKEPEL
ncbi:MAG: hypothetical protein Q7R41_13080 [Phycisphaerales bacterium]|nr:hypothetical protein [Phycisphaerales bacterium]